MSRATSLSMAGHTDRDYALALRLGTFVLRRQVAMKQRHNRDAATELVKRIAAAARAAGRCFLLDALDQVNALTAVSTCTIRCASSSPRGRLPEPSRAWPRRRATLSPRSARAIELLRRAQTLDERIGVKGRIGQLETLLRQPAADAA